MSILKNMICMWFGPKKIIATSWGCNSCGSTRSYINGTLTPDCPNQEVIIHLGDPYIVSCPLIPLDGRGKEIPFEKLQTY